MRVPLGKGDYERAFARAAALKFINRMYEESPQNQKDQVALISRPGSTFEETAGPGPIRATFTSPGMFGGDLFFVSGQTLYQKPKDDAASAVSGGIFTPTGKIRVAGAKGAGYERLFFSDEGNRLLMYQATGTGNYTSELTHNPAIGGSSSFFDMFPGVDNIYYDLTTGSVDAGTPAGTLSNPWLISNSAGPANTFEKFVNAINDTGINGTDYSTALVQNPRVEAALLPGGVGILASNRIAGTPDPPISVTAVPRFVWSQNPLSGGTAAGLSSVTTPSNFNVGSVAELASHVLILKSGSQRVYFIRPGNTVINADDFFEAESDTDNLVDIVVTGDQVWLMGEKSIEPWFLSGSLDPIASPFEPAKGQAISVGVLPGSVVNHDGRIYFAASDQNVYELAGTFRQISNPGVSERIRRALQAQGQ